MNYIFVAPIFNLKLNKKVNSGLRLGDLIISNSKNILSKTILKEPLHSTIGVHSSLEFINHEEEISTFAYLHGEVKSLKNHEDFMIKYNKNGKIVNTILAKIQAYLFELWKLKDNNVYIRDGFLLVYDDIVNGEYNNARTYKYSLSEVFSKSDLDKQETIFSPEEMRKIYNDELCKIEVKKLFEISMFDEEPTKSISYDDLFNKNAKATKIEKAYYYIGLARNSVRSPEKNLYYISALECLMGTSTEIAHQVSERVAVILGSSLDDRIRLYNLVKKSYNFRSKIIHGEGYQDSHTKNIEENSKGLDGILRELVMNNKEIFEMKQNEFNEYMLKEILS